MIITPQQPPDRLSLKGRLLAAHDMVKYSIDESYRDRAVSKRFIRAQIKETIHELQEVLKLLE